MLRLKYCSQCKRPHHIQYLYKSCFDCCIKHFKWEYDEMKKRHPQYPFRAGKAPTTEKDKL